MTAAIARAQGLPFVDVHSALPADVDPGAVIELMDRGGVSRTILSATARGGPESVLLVASKHPGRLVLAAHVPLAATRQSAAEVERALDQQLRLPLYEALAPLVLFRPARPRSRAPEVVVAADDPRVMTALALARARRWPFVVDVALAEAGSRRAALVGQLERLMSRHPDHPFALSHMGQLDAAEARRLIAAHVNLYLVASAADGAGPGAGDVRWTPVVGDGQLAPAWRALMLERPERFVVALDSTASADWGMPYLARLVRWRRALQGLPGPVAQAVAHRNAERLWRLP